MESTLYLVVFGRVDDVEVVERAIRRVCLERKHPINSNGFDTYQCHYFFPFQRNHTKQHSQ